MALEAALKFNGEEKYYIIQDVDYEITQSIDNNFKPSGNPKGGLINFTILSPDYDDLRFHQWVLEPKEKKSGTFFLPISKNTEHHEKLMHFKDAFCVGLREYHSNSNGLQVYMHITISASYIEWDNKTIFTNNALVKQ